MRPLAIDLFCGLGGWTEGLLAEGYDVVGFDIERHSYPLHSLPERPEAEKSSAFDSSSDPDGHNQRINRMRDALKGKEVIGWQEYPAQLVIQDVLTIHGSQFKDAALIVASPPCQGYSYRAMPWKRAKALPPPDNSLFEACFRIQREAIEAAGHHIPLVVENVRGAQKWVGRARWHLGSFYLWGDVPALMPIAKKAIKVPSFRFDGFGGSFQSASVRRTDVGKGARFTSRDCGVEGMKAVKIAGGCHAERGQNDPAKHWSGSSARKAASAAIAKIPFVLSQHIAKAWKPEAQEQIA